MLVALWIAVVLLIAVVLGLGALLYVLASAIAVPKW